MMKSLIIFFSLIVGLIIGLGCSNDLKCVKRVAKKEKRFIYELVYKNNKDTVIVTEFQIRDEGVIHPVIQVLDDNHKIILQYPRNEMIIKKLKDTTITHGSTCVEWKTN